MLQSDYKLLKIVKLKEKERKGCVARGERRRLLKECAVRLKDYGKGYVYMCMFEYVYG